MKLYYSKNLNPRVAVAVAKHLNSPVEYIYSMPRHPAHEEEFRKINPNTLVPVLVEEHQTLWETDAIACRLSAIAKSDFWVTGDKQPEMIMWISWANHHLTRPGGTLYFERLIRPTFSNVPVPPQEMDDATNEFRRYAKILDDLLEGRKWLIDNRLTYADFRTASIFPFADAAGLPMDGLNNIKRWHDQLMEIDAWRDPFANLS